MSDKRLDDMLSNWPLAPRSQLEWDEAAERVVGALGTPKQRDAASPSDDALLAPPLPKLPEEGQTAQPVRSTGVEPAARPGSIAASAAKQGTVTPGLAVENKMSKERGRDRSSFQELAKLASIPPTPAPPSVSGSQTPPPSSATPGVVRAEEGSSTDSGIVDLKMIAMADPSGADRAQSTPLASEGLFDDDQAAPQPAAPVSGARPAPASAPPASTSSVPTAAPAVAQAPSAAVKSAKATVEAREKKGGGGIVLVLGALATVGAIAAGAFFFVKSQRSHHEAVSTTTVATPATAEEAKKTAPTPAASASVAQADDTEVDDNAVDITNAPPGTKPTAHKHVKAGGAPVASAAAAPPPPASGAIDPKLVANVPTGPAGGGSGDLAEAMKAAAGGGTGMGQGGDTQQGPKFAPGSVPQRPSQGQVQGAIGNVMPAVKACLGSDDPVSRANVVFQSDGTVKSVSVSGFAAGKPQEACIKGALSKAKVDPFAESSYSIPVSIRP